MENGTEKKIYSQYTQIRPVIETIIRILSNFRQGNVNP